MGLISDGTTIFDAGSMAAGLGASMTFIKKLTASSSGTLSFVDGSASVVLDNTYKEYLFIINQCHPSAKSNFAFQGSINTGSGYGVNITSTHFQAKQDESGGDSGALSYEAGRDLAQSTAFFELGHDITDDNDGSLSGTLSLFNPANTTFVKHFIAVTNTHQEDEGNRASIENFKAGYCNTTSAIDAVQFKMSANNIDAGDICLYGIS